MAHLRPGGRDNPLCWYLGAAETLAWKGSESARASIIDECQARSNDTGDSYMIVGSDDRVKHNVHPKEVASGS